MTRRSRNYIIQKNYITSQIKVKPRNNKHFLIAMKKKSVRLNNFSTYSKMVTPWPLETNGFLKCYQRHFLLDGNVFSGKLGKKNVNEKN